jgi:hypothetical protein
MVSPRLLLLNIPDSGDKVRQSTCQPALFEPRIIRLHGPSRWVWQRWKHMKIDKAVVVRVEPCKENYGAIPLAARKIKSPPEFASLDPVRLAYMNCYELAVP